MDTSRPSNHQQLYTLNEAAQKLGVSIDTLLTWNEYNILKPTITYTGQVAYAQEQVNQFLAIRQLSQNTQVPNQPEPENKTFSLTPFLFITAGVATLVVAILTRPIKFDLQPTETAALESATPTPLAQLNPSPDSGLAENNIITYGQSTNFDPAKENPDSVIDSDGNIKGETSNTDVLAAAIGANGSAQNYSAAKPPFDPVILLPFLAIGLLSLPFIFKKKPAYSAQSSLEPVQVSVLPDTASQEQKIIEVNQKTDGTVVLCFGTREYKVSKPELDSESDRFIERLMGLAAPENKEIQYDSFEDPDIKFSAPLSKLVTRLGFVGTIRDLFFPRTSKNRVLFRRYITNRDLASMHLTPNQVENVFSSGN